MKFPGFGDFYVARSVWYDFQYGRQHVLRVRGAVYSNQCSELPSFCPYFTCHRICPELLRVHKTRRLFLPAHWLFGLVPRRGINFRVFPAAEQISPVVTKSGIVKRRPPVWGTAFFVLCVSQFELDGWAEEFEVDFFFRDAHRIQFSNDGLHEGSRTADIDVSAFQHVRFQECPVDETIPFF